MTNRISLRDDATCADLKHEYDRLNSVKDR